MNSEQAKNKYREQAHRMQSGVAMMMSRGSAETDPKHLRVGINAAMSDQGGLVKLLISKGIITEEEYLNAIAEQMTEEANDYEKKVQEVLGSIKVKLG